MNIIDKGVQGLQSVTDTAQDLSELASTHRQFIVKQVANILLLLVILVVFGCFDFVHLTFHFEYLKDPNYWGNVAMKVISDICAYNIGINFVIDDVIKRNKVLGKIKNTYEALNSHKERDFEYFVSHVYNPQEKKKMYIDKINRQIYMLNRFSKKSDHILYNSELEEKQALKEKNRYCIKRAQLEYLKSDEYIDKNLESLKVNYREVDHSVFELEINGAQKIKQGKVTGSIGKGRLQASFTTALSIVGITMFLSSFRVDPSKEEFVDGAIAAANYIIKMCTDIGIIIWQFFRGVLSATGIVSQQMTAPYVVRVDVLKRYYAWRQNKGEYVPQCYLDLFKGMNQL